MIVNLKIIRDYENTFNNNPPLTPSPKVLPSLDLFQTEPPPLSLSHTVLQTLPLSPLVRPLPMSPKIKELIKRTESWDNFIKIQWPWVI